MHKIELVCHKQACLRQTGMTQGDTKRDAPIAIGIAIKKQKI